MALPFALTLISLLFGCSKYGREENFSCPERLSGSFRVKRLASSQSIDASDSSLSDWNIAFVVLAIDSNNAATHQLKQIHGKPSRTVDVNDFGIKVYMSRDSVYWYIGVEVVDDQIVSSITPYSGDCLEMFFAATNIESPIGIHRLINASGNQAAFFQFVIPAITLSNQLDYFPAYATDAAFRKNILLDGFSTISWKTAVGWSAEARIPLNALDLDTITKLNGHQKLRMNIDYLDYDEKAAENSVDDNWGYDPDNVFCLDDNKDSVVIPKCMPTVVFE